MQNAVEITTVAHAIQLAVAPVFLLTGIGAILNVITTRIARIVDRSRALDNSGDQNRAAHEDEIRMLARRARWVHWAVSLCTLSALFICIVIAALFAGSEIGMDPSRVVSLFFISAMLALIFGLLCFLREIYLATGNLEKRNIKGASSD
jgi:Mg2+/Co2+ transporter CorB